MPPKSSNKKNAASAAATWYHCEICNVHITSKDRETHEKHCPITSDNSEPLEYIYDNCMHAIGVQKRTFNIEELKDLSAKYVNNLIFISEGAMRLMHLHIGQRVLIRTKQGGIGETDEAYGLVRLVWPIPDRFLTTAFVGEEDYKLHWSDLQNKTLKIYALPSGCTTVAKTVCLRVTAIAGDGNMELADVQLKNVERLLKFDLKNLILANGSYIFMDFFNKDITMQVVSWTSFAEDISDTVPESRRVDTLNAKFENLKLDSSPAIPPQQYFEITSATRFEIERILNEQNKLVKEIDSTKVNVVTKFDIGGLEKQIELIEEAMDMALGFKAVPAGVKISRGFILHGPTGCGKSLLCDAMCSTIQEKTGKSSPSIKADIIRIFTSELFSKFLGETEKNLLSYFEKAFANYPKPTLIIIEDVQNLCPKYESNEMLKRVGAAFLGILDMLNGGSRKETQRTFLLASTSQIDTLNPNARRCGRLDSEIEVPAPTPKQRAAILNCLLRNTMHTLTTQQIDDIAQVSHGYVGADLANLVYAAAMRAVKDEVAPRALDVQDLLSSLTHIKPSAMREVLIENPNVHWTDIGGQDDLKLKLKQAIEWPLLHPDKFERLGLKPPRGILMYGPPGCSKTMIAKALATESQLNFLSIKGPELFSMWVGESERAVREVFRKARQVAPAIVFFDEIDAIGGERSEGGSSSSGTSVKERVLTQLLTEMDGVEALENVTIVAATNRPDMIDKALLRPGRFDRIVYVGLPDVEARQEIFRIKLQHMPLASDVSIDKLVQHTEGYSGAEIQAICQEAALKCLEESFEAQHVRWAHFEYALIAVQPRTSNELLQLYAEYVKQ